MPANRHTPWLVCYDIADPKRLVKVHREVSKGAVPLQYSVFLATANRRGAVRLVDTVATRINDRQDDLRAYPLLTSATHHIYGRGRLAEGVHFIRTLGSLTDSHPTDDRSERWLDPALQ